MLKVKFTIAEVVVMSPQWALAFVLTIAREGRVHPGLGRQIRRPISAKEFLHLRSLRLAAQVGHVGASIRSRQRRTQVERPSMPGSSVINLCFPSNSSNHHLLRDPRNSRNFMRPF
jgi:hypothetical protein